MTLVDKIREVTFGLKTGRFLDEVSVSNGVVLPILLLLRWPIFDGAVVARH